MEIATLADVRILVEKHLPKEYRSKFTWRQLAGLLRRAAEGQQDVAVVSDAIRIVLQIEASSAANGQPVAILRVRFGPSHPWRHRGLTAGPVVDPAVMAERRFPTPWMAEETDACFVVKDHNGQALTYVSFEEEPGRRTAANLLTRDEARRIAANIARLPELLRAERPDVLMQRRP